MENTNKIAYIESLFTVTDITDTSICFEAPDCSSAEILFTDFEIGDSAKNICGAATYYSCCGDRLDRDYMICPSCFEHC